jgi:membrane protein
MWQKYSDEIRNSQPVNWVREGAKRIVLPGFEGLNLHYVASFFASGLKSGALALRASAISFQFVMAFLPSVLFLFSLIPILSTGFEGKLLELIQDILPANTWSFFSETIIGFVNDKRADITIVTLVLFLYYSSRSISTILAAFSRSVNLVKNRGYFFRLIVSVLIILGLSALVVTALSISTAMDWVADTLREMDILSDGIQRWGFFILNFLIVLMLYTAAISILYNVGNQDDKGWRIFSAGTTFSSLMMILVSRGFAYYVNHFANYEQVYGIFGILIIFFLWIYFNSLILLIGFELNASISKAQFHQKADV